ncbi:beta-ketoacyl synthase N-terminal-like domain-containing protein, partial [Streptomyces sp. HSW2009]|uniref:beta-ketoacyl synthase N-terminal-like domain-containing protein n=1 Tax=Streptomyces sp. HSW2009 TaxID=3142890 RepID=UPI0032EC4CB4
MNAYISGIGMVAPGVRTLDDLDGPQAPDAVPADWFDPVPFLGKRGWKYFTPATRYLLAAANEAQGTRHGDAPPADQVAERVGVTTGTHHSISAMHQRLDQIAREEGPAGMSPAELPGFSVNMPASQLAISLRCRAFSVTLTNPVVAGLEAVLFAASALAAGRADRVLATATEEAPAAYGVAFSAAMIRSPSF